MHTAQCTLHHVVSKYSSAGIIGKLQTTMFEKVRSVEKNPSEFQSGKLLLYWATERLEHSIFHKQDALSTLVNRCNWV